MESPKWVIAQFILKAIGSRRAKKTASRLKIPDVERFIDIMKVIVIADLFERAYSDFISELEENEKLKRFVDVKGIPDLRYLYKLHSKLDIKAISTFFTSFLVKVSTPAMTGVYDKYYLNAAYIVNELKYSPI